MAKQSIEPDLSATPTNQSIEQWLLIRYLPTTLFSLRMTHATSKGGKTLLVPTPYAVKLAFIDASFRIGDPDLAESVLAWLKDRKVRFRPPEHCVVLNTFIKIKQEKRGAPKGIYESTIAYREFCYYRGELTIAISVGGLEAKQIEMLKKVAAHINYLGKRGSFMQFIGTEDVDILPEGFTHPLHDPMLRPGLYAKSSFLDDFGKDAFADKKLFDRISTYGKGTVSLGKHRILVPTLLPYRLVRSSRGFSHYRRIDGGRDGAHNDQD